MSADTVGTVLESVGLYVFATSGALMAIHKGLDVGIMVLPCSPRSGAAISLA